MLDARICEVGAPLAPVTYGHEMTYVGTAYKGMLFLESVT
jgi:hypothetical protein